MDAFGEDWSMESDEDRVVVRDASGAILCSTYAPTSDYTIEGLVVVTQRLVKCVNACVGMIDPETEIDNLRQRLITAEAELANLKRQ